MNDDGVEGANRETAVTGAVFLGLVVVSLLVATLLAIGGTP